MALSKKKAAFRYDVKTIWNIVTSLDHYSWRSDLNKIEILNEKEFIEYSKDGYATAFTITAWEPFHRWEFDMENDNMSGHWTGVFSQNGDETLIDFTEEVIAKKFIMKPFVKSYLAKQQAVYIRDLEKALENSL
jgi:Polyketide cyclase / dehydrase and lipid transport.